MKDRDHVRDMEQVVRRVMKTVAKYDKIGKTEFESILGEVVTVPCGRVASKNKMREFWGCPERFPMFSYAPTVSGGVAIHAPTVLRSLG